MNLLFVYPNFTRQTTPQVGIASLLGIIAAKHRVSFFDLTTVPPGQEISAFMQTLVSVQPDYVLFSCRTNEWGLVRRYIEAAYPTPCIVGGIHATVCPDEVIAYAKIVVRGEAEHIIGDLLFHLEHKQDIRGIPNVWVKQAGTVYKNEVAPLIQDLDSLPMPLWSAFDEKHFYGSYIKSLFSDINCVGTFETTRGCPYACSYCCNYTLRRIYAGKGAYHRRKSPQRVAAEIAAFKRLYTDANFYYFVDDTFMVDEGWLKEFSALYDKTPFVFMTRAEMVTDAKMRLIADMKGRAVSIGIESGNEDFRRRVLARTMTNKQIIKAFKMAREYGLKTYSFNMVGLPHETPADIQATIALNKRIKPDKAQFTVFFPFKGTQLYDECKKHGYINGFYPDLFNYYDRSFLTMPQLPKEEIARWVHEAHKQLN